MKLQELINTKYKTSNKDTQYDLNDLEGQRLSNAKKRFTDPEYQGGSGVFAHVEVQKDSPFIAKKQNHFPVYDINKDSYFAYVNAIAKNHLSQKNPFFPRVYSVDVEKDSNGLLRPSYDIETLQGPDNFDTEALMSLGKKLFSEFDGYFTVGKNIAPLDVTVQMSRILLRNLHSHTRRDIRNKHLVEAMDLITQLLQDNKGFFWLDMHAGNIMFRGTPHGPQLVITDPLTDDQDPVK